MTNLLSSTSSLPDPRFSGTMRQIPPQEMDGWFMVADLRMFEQTVTITDRPAKKKAGSLREASC
jgi:predicted NUDIX family NTP pyrophosphohydrolase